MQDCPACRSDRGTHFEAFTGLVWCQDTSVETLGRPAYQSQRLQSQANAYLSTLVAISTAVLPRSIVVPAPANLESLDGTWHQQAEGHRRIMDLMLSSK